MELLQGFQYFWIDDCKNPINQALTVVGFLHICLQPYFTHVLNSANAKSPNTILRFQVVKRLSLMAGAALFIRYLVSGW
jgi:hypothetical protein